MKKLAELLKEPRHCRQSNRIAHEGNRGGTRMPGSNQATPIEILLVEDSADDADLMKVALLEGTLPLRVNWVEDGEQALQFLHQEGDYLGAPQPDLILLDLRLPRKNGQEVLEEIRRDPKLRSIPVVVLTANDAVIPQLYDF